MSDTTIALMRENLVIPEADEIEIVSRPRPSVPPEEFLPFKAGPNGVPPMPDFGDGYRILHSLNPHDETGSIHWDPDVFEDLYDRITGKITDNYDDIVQTEPVLPRRCRGGTDRLWQRVPPGARSSGIGPGPGHQGGHAQAGYRMACA